jgi:hypothetical protein
VGKVETVFNLIGREKKGDEDEIDRGENGGGKNRRKTKKELRRFCNCGYRGCQKV